MHQLITAPGRTISVRLCTRDIIVNGRDNQEDYSAPLRIMLPGNLTAALVFDCLLEPCYDYNHPIRCASSNSRPCAPQRECVKYRGARCPRVHGYSCPSSISTAYSHLHTSCRAQEFGRRRGRLANIVRGVERVNCQCFHNLPLHRNHCTLFVSVLNRMYRIGVDTTGELVATPLHPLCSHPHSAQHAP